MQTNLEQVIEIIKKLPVEDFSKLRQVMDEEQMAKGPHNEELQSRIERYKEARKWINQNSEEYMNQWVCLDGGELVACGSDARKVYNEAKNTGIETPFMHHIVDESLPFGGW
jgi:uncharacterized protein (UPF0335 family)